MKVIGKFDSLIQSSAKFILFFGVIFLILSFGFNLIQNDKKQIVTTNVDAVKYQREKIYSLLEQEKKTDDKAVRAFFTVYRSIFCSAIGEACTDNPADAAENFKSSWAGVISGLIMIPYQSPPASGVYALQNTLENAGFVPKTYAAQGIGFASLKPIAKLWKLFRDFSYIFLVLILIIMGFMIMFRMKINPQTVIGLEQAIPSIIISLILITFSFSIAGFLIDLMYVLIAVGISLLADANVGDLVRSNTQMLQNRYIGGGLLEIWPYKGTAGIFDTGQALYSIFPGFIQAVIGGVLTFPIANYFVHLGRGHLAEKTIYSFRDIAGATFGIGDLPQLIWVVVIIIVTTVLLPFIPAFLMGLLMFFTLIFFFFRIFFMLLASYIKIIMFIIFAPVILILSGRTFTFWFKNLFAEIMSFPIVIWINLIGYALINLTIANETLFRPPFLHEISGDAFGPIIGMGLILMTPKLVASVKEAMGVKPGGFGVGPGIFFGGVGAVAGGAMSGLSTIGSLHFALGGLFGERMGGHGKGFLGALVGGSKQATAASSAVSQTTGQSG